MTDTNAIIERHLTRKQRREVRRARRCLWLHMIVTGGWWPMEGVRFYLSDDTKKEIDRIVEEKV